MCVYVSVSVPYSSIHMPGDIRSVMFQYTHTNTFHTYQQLSRRLQRYCEHILYIYNKLLQNMYVCMCVYSRTESGLLHSICMYAWIYIQWVLEAERMTGTDKARKRDSNVNTIFHLPTEFIFTVVRFSYQLLFGCSFSFSPTVHMNAFTIFFFLCVFRDT